MSEMKLIMEGWRAYQSDDFDFLCESYRRRTITEARLFELWERNTSHEYQQLLNEGVMDILSIGYEKGKKLIGKAKEAYDAAVAKVSDFFLKLSVQAMNLIGMVKNGVTKVAGVLGNIYRKVDAFCDKHPIICKVVKILIAVIAVAAVVALFSSSAEAAVQVTNPSTGEPLTLNDDGVSAIKAVLQLGNEGKDPEVQQVYADAVQWLEKAHASETLHDVSKETGLAQKYIQTSMDIINDILKDDPNVSMQTFINQGEKVRVMTNKMTQEIYATGVGSKRTAIEWQSLVVK